MSPCHPERIDQSGAKTGAVDWCFLLPAVILTLALVEIPYLVAYSQGSRGFVFTGAFHSPHDLCCYVAAMREGANNASWLVHNHLTSEPHKAAFVYTPYVAVGKLAGSLGVDFEIAFHLAELFGRVALLVSIYALSRVVLDRRGSARLAFILATFATGIGLWLQAVAPGEAAIGGDMGYAELNTFLTLFAAPHVMLGLALVLIALTLYLRAWTSGSYEAGVLAGISTLGIGVTNPFGLPALCLTVFAHLVCSCATWRRAPLQPVVALVIMVAASFPFFIHSLLVFSADPFWGVAYGARNITPTPPVPALAATYVVLVALAATGLKALARRPTPQVLLILLWLTSTAILMYAPVPYQRRFAPGFAIALAVVATTGLERLLPWIATSHGSRLPPRRLVVLLLLATALVGTNGGVYAVKCQEAGLSPRALADRLLFQPQAIVDAAGWLAGMVGDDDVVLADPLTSNFIARWGRGRVYAGHPIATLDFESKAQKALGFLSGKEPPEQRRAFLTANNITYVFCGPAERALGADWLLEAPFVRLIYDSSDVYIFAVDVGQP